MRVEEAGKDKKEINHRGHREHRGKDKVKSF